MTWLLGVAFTGRDILREFPVSLKAEWDLQEAHLHLTLCHPAISCIYPGRGLRVCAEVPGRGPTHGPRCVPPGQGERACHHLHR